jgi:hypothetical protein
MAMTKQRQKQRRKRRYKRVLLLPPLLFLLNRQAGRPCGDDCLFSEVSGDEAVVREGFGGVGGYRGRKKSERERRKREGRDAPLSLASIDLWPCGR